MVPRSHSPNTQKPKPKPKPKRNFQQNAKTPKSNTHKTQPNATQVLREIFEDEIATNATAGWDCEKDADGTYVIKTEPDGSGTEPTVLFRFSGEARVVCVCVCVCVRM